MVKRQEQRKPENIGGGVKGGGRFEGQGLGNDGEKILCSEYVLNKHKLCHS